jgi:hypothetical protein
VLRSLEHFVHVLTWWLDRSTEHKLDVGLGEHQLVAFLLVQTVLHTSGHLIHIEVCLLQELRAVDSWIDPIIVKECLTFIIILDPFTIGCLLFDLFNLCYLAGRGSPRHDQRLTFTIEVLVVQLHVLVNLGKEVWIRNEVQAIVFLSLMVSDWLGGYLPDRGGHRVELRFVIG